MMAVRPHPYFTRRFAAWLVSSVAHWGAAAALIVRLLGRPGGFGPWELGLLAFLVLNLVPQLIWKLEAETYLYMRMRPNPAPPEDR